MQIISFETAKLLKESVYNEPTQCSYDKMIEVADGVLFYKFNKNYNQPKRNYTVYNDAKYSAPYQYEVVDWLRNEHRLHIEISLENFSDDWIWQYAIFKIHEDYTMAAAFDGEYKSYEDALEAGLIAALKQI